MDPVLLKLIPLFAMIGFTMIVAIGATLIGRFLGPRKYSKSKMSTYECGIPPTGGARDRISVKYYLVAILFLLFDLEVAYLLPVALAWDQLSTVGPIILGFMGFFFLFFLLSLFYEFKIKALEWER